MELHIPVSENFSLFAGTTERKAELMIIHPPEKSLFDQLCARLDQRPSPTAGFNQLLSLARRRFTDRQAGKVIRQSAESLSPFVSDFPLWVDNLMQLPPWPERLACLQPSSLYPKEWSLAESSAQVQFKCDPTHRS